MRNPEPVWSSEFQGAFEHWRYLLGDELLAFLVNADAPRADDPRTGRTVRKLSATLDLLEREDPRIPVALVRMRRADGLPVAWEMRKANGGDVPAPQGADELELVLTRLARDVYPVLLGPSDAMVVAGPGLALPAADASIGLDQLVESHPERQRAAALLEATGLQQSELVVVSAFATDRLAEAATPSAIIAAAARRLRHVERPDPASFMGLVLRGLDRLRALAEGHQTRVPAFIGFTALPLSQARGPMTLPQGELRPPTQSERRFVPFALQAEAVLSTTVACQTFAPGKDAASLQIDGQTALNQQAREVILAAALADDGVPRSCPSVAWVVSQDIGPGSGSFRPLHPERAPGRADPMSDEEIKAIDRWASHVATADLRHVDIAVDRTLRAIWETDWTDSVIDAVIAWENLVGTRSETAYRVTAALAVLCQDDPEKRIAARKELGSAYDARSRLVHGDPAPRDLHRHRDLAIQTALEALRRLMTERQDLLALSSSSKRADRLLLGI